MNVNQLIAELQKVKDKSLEVLRYTGERESPEPVQEAREAVFHFTALVGDEADETKFFLIK